jgi:CubicO group peptidase (beta-lactamase class C family)
LKSSKSLRFKVGRMVDVPAALDLAELAAWNPTVLVQTEGRSSPATVSSERVVYGASVAKQFTAFLAALFVADGWWTTADRIRNLVPELPSWAEEIEVQHLVYHSSGLPGTPRLRESGVVFPVTWGNLETLTAIVREVSPVRPPGVAWEYCNLGYVLLAVAIERLADRPLVDLARERLFEPAGMTTSHVGGPPSPARRMGTEPETVGDGGLWTTPVDLERWNQAMNSRAFGSAVHDLAERPGELRDGSLLANGWGVGIMNSAGRTFFHRGGNVDGWTVKVVRERTSGTSVVLATDGAPPQLVHDTALKIAATA